MNTLTFSNTIYTSFPKNVGIQGHEQEIEEKIKNNEHSSALSYVIQEKNKELVVKWFNNQLEKQLHPLLCLEFSQQLKNIPSSLSDAFAYRELGLLLCDADAALVLNSSELTAKQFFCYHCKLPPLDKKTEQIGKEILNQKLSIIQEHPDRLASPAWICDYTAKNEKVALKPENEWESIRLKFLNH